MMIIACVDENNGLMFNHRRQSRDSIVCRDILQECRGKKLYMSAYSSRLFEEAEKTEEAKEAEREETKEAEGIENSGKAERAEIEITEDILKRAGNEDACFIEDTEITGFEEKIQKVILYKWNRRYPADRYLSLELSDGSWGLLQTEEFKGSSHERITEEIYEKKKAPHDH